jgi:hypothetical protein
MLFSTLKPEERVQDGHPGDARSRDLSHGPTSSSDSVARIAREAAFLLTLACALAGAAKAQFIQQGGKLIGTGATGYGNPPIPAPLEGFAVGVSADGNAAIVGGFNDGYTSGAGGLGAAWMYTRSGGEWAQQGSKLVGSDSSANADQGQSVALSGDGNTAIMGGANDSGGPGAAWVFTQSGGVWTQQGGKLVGTGASGNANQGNSVALSTDGNTAIVGGSTDAGGVGAAWVFTRSGGTWTQQGGKLVGTGAIGNANQGQSVALSGDGNTAIVGGPNDSGGAGAAWVFTRSGSTWTQQGSKLFGTGAIGSAEQGYSVALSSDASTAMVGGYNDNGGIGGAWVFTQSGGVWTQQGGKLVGTGAVGNADQGFSVALSSNGNTALLGGPCDNGGSCAPAYTGPAFTYTGGVGAAWVYTRSGAVWTQLGSKLVGTGANGNAMEGYSVALSGDASTAVLGGPWDNHVCCNASVGAAWVFVASAQSGTTYDATAAFEQGWTSHSNPNGVWSYGYSSGFTSPITLYSTTQLGLGSTQLWVSPAVENGGSPNAALNDGPAFNNGNLDLLADQFVLTSGIGGQYSDLVFTAPTAGTYSVASTFRGDQYCIGVVIGVVLNGNVIFNSSITADGQTVPFNTTVTLQVGNTIVFSVGPGGGCQNTGLSATITGPAPVAFFTGEVSLGSGVYYLQFPDGIPFGYFNFPSSSILYHYDMGFEAFVPGSAADLYFYDFTTDHWWYTSSTLFPYLYDFTLKAWIYYFPNMTNTGHYTTNPRYFGNLTTGVIFTM